MSKKFFEYSDPVFSCINISQVKSKLIEHVATGRVVEKSSLRHGKYYCNETNV